MTRFFFLVVALVAASFSLVLAAPQQTPSFTGKWHLDTDRSDDGEALIRAGLEGTDRTSGQVKPQTRQTAERLVTLSRALTWLEIRQTATDFKIYDDADNVRIYYIDGKKHPRETPWGAKLETVTNWEGAELHMKTDGKDVGQVHELYSLEGEQLLFTVKIKVKDVKDEITVRTFYNRAKD